MNPRPVKNTAMCAGLIGFALLLALCATARAASEKVLYRFHGKDGWGPGSVIVAPDGTLYGTTWFGGGKNLNKCSLLGCGEVFQLTRGANGKWHEKVLHAFGGSDGETLIGDLVSDQAGNLYGTTVYGGDFRSCSNQGCGVVFELVRGTGGKWTEKTLHTFEVSDGAAPYGGLIFDSQGNVYGTTSGGGDTSTCTGGCGVVFQLTPGASGKWTETVLYSFQGTDGEGPRAPVTFDAAGNLYGTAQFGGAQGTGAVFELTRGAGGKWTEQVLYSFDDSDTRDGYQPVYGVTFVGAGNLYGTTQFGGTVGQQGWGTAFELTPAGGGKWKETILRTFDENKVGGGFVSSGLFFDRLGNLYGATSLGGKYTCPYGGSVGCGVVFKLTLHANGKWAEAVLHSFGKGKDGAGPSGNLSRDSAGHLFGLTAAGGYLGGPCGQGLNAGCGVVFEVVP